MGVYLLGCNKEKAEELWKRWFEVVQISRSMFMRMAVPEPHFMAKKPEEEPNEAEKEKKDSYTQLFLQFRPTITARILYITGLLLGLFIFEKMLLALPNIGISLLAQAPFFVFYITLLLCLSGLSPLLLLSYGALLIRRSEIEFQNFVTDERDDPEYQITIFPLSPPQSWVLFPGDILIIQGTVSGLFFIQFFQWFGVSQILIVLIPYVLIIMAAGMLVLARKYAFERIADAFHVLMYWKLEMARLAGRISHLFLFPLLFYLVISLLRVVSLSLPIWHKKVVFGDNYIPPVQNSSVANNGLVTIVGNPPGFETWQGLKSLKAVQTIIYVIDPTLQEIVFGAGLILIIILLILYLRRLSDIFNTKRLKSLLDVWKMLNEEEDSTVSEKIDQKSFQNLCRNTILLNWFLLFIINTFGIISITTSILWMFNSRSEWLSIGWAAPLEWYREAFKSLLGNVAGSIVSQILLLGICAPALLWLGMWLHSLVNSYKSLILLLSFRRDKYYYYVNDVLVRLCTGQSIASPIVRIERNSVDRVDTTPLLPTVRFCVICLSEPLIASLTEKQRELVLEHELAHATKHAVLLWWTQFLSIFSVIGSGYLSLLLDHRKIELEADNAAVKRSEDIPIFEDALYKPAILTQTLSENKQTQPNVNLGIVKQIVDLYEFYFGTSVWGQLYPTPNKRIGNLHRRFSTVEKQDQFAAPIVEIIEEERESAVSDTKEEWNPDPQMKEPGFRQRNFPKYKKLLQFCLAILMIVGSIGLLLHNAAADGIATDKAQETATAQTMNTVTSSNATIAAGNATIVSSNATANTHDNILIAHVDTIATAGPNATTPDPYPPLDGVLVLYDSLSQPSDWSEGSDSSFGGTCQFVNTAYHASESVSNHLFTCFAKDSDFTKFAFEVQIKITKGDCGGIFFKYNNRENSYIYLVCSDGAYFFLSSTSSSQKTLAAHYSSATRKGLNQPNTIAVVANINTFDLYINHQKIDSIHDNTSIDDPDPSYTSIGLIVADLSKPSEIIYSYAREWVW